MSTSDRPLPTTVLLLAVMVAGVAGVLHLWSTQRFLPSVRFREALAKGDGCVVTLGDSRMVAGIQPAVLAGALEAHGASSCVADLANGAVEFQDEYITLRRYLAAGKHPRTVVLGHAGDSLLQGAPVDPARLVGNRSLTLAWSQASDITTLYPGFPLQNFDLGLRFLVTRATPLGVHESLLWQKAQLLQDALKPPAHREANEFGAKEDMRALAVELAARAAGKGDDGKRGLHPWVAKLVQDLGESGSSLVVVDVPMPSAFRRMVSGAPYRAALDQALLGVHRLDASDLLGDERFADALHMDGGGAVMFSQWLGREVARRLAPPGEQPAMGAAPRDP